MEENNKDINLDNLVIKAPQELKNKNNDGIISHREIKREENAIGIPMAHLHLHTFHSILDGCGSIDNYIKQAKKYKHPAIAITDHGTMSGTFEFSQKCKANDIKPIIGSELYINDNIGEKEAKKEEGKNSHQIVFVKNKVGYENLNRLLYLSFTEGFYRRGRIKTEWLFKYKEGLFITTSCMGSPFGKLLNEGKEVEAEALFKRYVDEMGSDFAAEIQINELEIQKKYNFWLIKMSNKYKVMLIITGDIHYAYPEDVELQDTLIAINRDSVVGEGSWKFHVRSLYYTNSLDFQRFNKQFKYDYPTEFIDMCLSNTLEIVEKCQFEFETNVEKFPKFEPPQYVLDYFKTNDTKQIIKRLARSKLKEKLKVYDEKKVVILTKEKIQDYINRLEYELKIIEDRKMLDYFMVYWEIIRDYRSKGHFIGPGRGSAAGSLLSWCLGITLIDPIRFDLYFERFLNPDRKCITENNDILMKDGTHKNIKNITLEDKNNIQTETGIGELVEIVSRNLEEGEDVYEIETENGSIVELTGNHLIPIFRNGKIIDIEVKNLINTDYLVTF